MFDETRCNSKKFDKRIWLSSPTMHGAEMDYVREAYDTNWMSTVGANLNEVERILCEKLGVGHSVALSAGTAALHMAVRLAGVKPGEKVFCSDLTFAATVNPIFYEGGVPIFIDSEEDTWNMSPEALELAFQRDPQVRVVVMVHLYGTPAKITELREICHRHGALLIEDAAESLGATWEGRQTGVFGDVACLSFNGNKIVTGSAGGALVTDRPELAEKVRKWSTQSREKAPWYQHEEIGYNYRMSNVIAGVIRGQMEYLDDHVAKKRRIYERYKAGFAGLPVQMNPFDEERSQPNYWLSCMTIDREALCPQRRGATRAEYEACHGKSCPTEILETLERYNAEGRPIWKPMHLQPIYRENGCVTLEDGNVGEDLFERGLCLPSDIKMSEEQQDAIIGIVRSCFA